MREPGENHDLVPWARGVCLGLPDARADHPFGPQTEMFRIHRKMFALVMDRSPVAEHPLLNLKADPQEIPLLRDTYDWILPGYHMNKRHWISVVLGPGVERALLEELVEDSYDHVVAGLPVALRPSVGRDGKTTRSAG